VRLGAVLGIAAAIAVGGWHPAAAQSWWGWRGNRAPPRFRDAEAGIDKEFAFCRVVYTSVRREALGHGWDTDYPEGDMNFMIRLGEFTTTGISRGDDGRPNYWVVRITDPELFDCPFVFMSDVGTAGFSPEEVDVLRSYLLRGGFLYVDDFWGDYAWDHWEREIGKILPPSSYPIEDLPPDHQVFRILYDIHQVPQIPSIQFWRRTGGQSTSERGAESATPHLRGISDSHGRLMVVMSHNTDIADGWEREGEEYEFFHRFSANAYAVGMNVLLYAMTH
jgi:hypothetical protein